MANNSNHSEIHALQSICYKRGSLQLLDQRKLPLETVYLDIKNASDGWFAIKEMVVRGAPAIAIAAALSLAVEAVNLEKFQGTADDAVSFLAQKLDYLVSSRPTAVNLSDAATKLKEIIVKAASTSSEANVVFQAYIEAAEIMLEDDVASNKAIGSYGASCFESQLKDAKKISILTHCNSGSLATAGYGTALGVIRAVHAQGILEKAYCTETRPFNQVSSCDVPHSKCEKYVSIQQIMSSLIAQYEVVRKTQFLHEGCSYAQVREESKQVVRFSLCHFTIVRLLCLLPPPPPRGLYGPTHFLPATLIADSAAAALMKAGRVQGVIVGADRVAANGDTANKIGTYSLAVCAKHHGIPFYVAAPLTSVDLSLPSGESIIIEERSPKELLNSRGGLGEQVAASGISVWNPAFDVTPANLISGIITEKGVITKSKDEDFDIRGFVQKMIAQ
ncbi:methylthioribose-1-phosphate isomerase-like [Chenopodium quinoa]|uniref:methylthioribose-1-phosphate isomerase-like n=1 Tax=Chenopodium quinoa TaxID=63459 RepID=UPI000B78480C|nr:methylthioribose-1-phosphate isomerase-like [Chenopodium quinoa]